MENVSIRNFEDVNELSDNLGGAVLNFDELPPEWQLIISLTRAEMYLQIYWKRQRKGGTKERRAFEALQNIREEITKLDLFGNEQKQD